MNWEEWWIFKNLSWITDKSLGKQWFINMGVLAYNIIYILAVFFMIFKIGQGYYDYRRRASASFASQRQGMKEELFEPFRGLFYLFVGLTVIEIIVNMVLGQKIVYKP